MCLCVCVCVLPLHLGDDSGRPLCRLPGETKGSAPHYDYNQEEWFLLAPETFSSTNGLVRARACALACVDIKLQVAHSEPLTAGAIRSQYAVALMKAGVRGWGRVGVG